MATLVIIVLLIGGTADGGAHSSITTLDFATKAECLKAAIVLETRGQLWESTVVKGGMYKVTTKCVERTWL